MQGIKILYTINFFDDLEDIKKLYLKMSIVFENMSFYTPILIFYRVFTSEPD